MQRVFLGLCSMLVLAPATGCVLDISGDGSTDDATSASQSAGAGTDTAGEQGTESDSSSEDTTATAATTAVDTSGEATDSTDATDSGESADSGVEEGGGEEGGTGDGCAGGPLDLPIQGCAPAVLPSSGDFAQDCVDRINQLRWECQCLEPLDRWTDAEACSDNQSAADQNGGGAHGNFGDCNENAQNTCPNWGSESQVIDGCLQAMWDEGPGEPFSEHGHYINMSSTTYTRVACGFSAGSAGVWANQNFRP